MMTFTEWPSDGIGQPGCRDHGHLNQVAQLLAVIYFWTTGISQEDEGQELYEHAAVAVGEPILARVRDVWQGPDRAVPEECRGSRREVFFRDHGEPLMFFSFLRSKTAKVLTGQR
jgi:hypothetical protein